MDRTAPPSLSIWIVNPFDDIPGEGLPPLRYWSLARVLAGRGHDVTWWTASWSHRRKASRPAWSRSAQEEGFAVKLVAVRPYAKNVSLTRLASHRDFGRTFERLANESVASGQLDRPDVIIASLPPLEGPEAAARLAKRLDAALVVDLMDAWPEAFERLLPGPAWLRRLVHPLLFGRMSIRRRSLLAAADAVSAAAQSYLDPLGRPAEGAKPVHVCHLGAWVAEFPPPPRLVDEVPVVVTDADSVQPSSPPPLACVYAGTLESGQDFDTLIAAARQLAAAGVGATIHVAGTGRLEPTLRQAAESIRGPCTIEVHGLLQRSDYVRLLASCAVGLVLVKPESRVALPYKACDYAAAGLALVSPLAGELERLVDTYRAGIPYVSGRGDSLAEAISMLARDPRRLLELRHGARRLAEAEFDRERTYAGFADWIEGIPSVAAAPPAG